MRTCTRCRLEKPKSDFGRHPQGRDGLQSRCRACMAEAARERRAANPEPFRAATRRSHARRKTIDVGTCALCDGPTHSSKYGGPLCKPHYDRARRYNLNVEDLRLIDARERCDICPKEPEVVDHDHVTGAVRGVLCRTCNAALGLFYDNPVTLISAIRYLRRSHP